MAKERRKYTEDYKEAAVWTFWLLACVASFDSERSRKKSTLSKKTYNA
jgi:hypothetical protein